MFTKEDEEGDAVAVLDLKKTQSGVKTVSYLKQLSGVSNLREFPSHTHSFKSLVKNHLVNFSQKCVVHKIPCDSQCCAC